MTELRILLSADPPEFGGAFAYQAEVQERTVDGWVTILGPDEDDAGLFPVSEVGDEEEETIMNLRRAFPLAEGIPVVRADGGGDPA